MVLATGACQGRAAVFHDSGVADTGTVLFDLRRGAVSVRYDVADREPFTGCTFRVALVRQPAHDPLAPGELGAESEDVRVEPRARLSGRQAFSVAQAGRHYLRIGGTCRWEVWIELGA